MNIHFDRELIEKFQVATPRYTSYPTANKFNFSFNMDTQLAQIKDLNKSHPISLYIHIPFCNTLCLYCACNKIITNDRKNITLYLEYLEKEIKLYYNLIKTKLKVVQLHFGGGSPSWLSESEISQVMTFLKKYFDFALAKEIAMEIDPRHCTTGFIDNLKNNGFNRISIGLQDTNLQVQKKVNRVQNYEESKLLLDYAREHGFNSTNVDLIYGLPYQSVTSFSETIDKVIMMKPDRIALFNYAHIPSIFMSQTRIEESSLPTPQVKLDILQMSVARLLDASYIFIGMDHFARKDDSLSKALFDGTLQRNFQGYSTFANTNMLSFGVSSIGFIGNSYYQNAKDLAGYYRSLDNNQLPILRGIVLNNDDIIRREIIQNIMCRFELNYAYIEDKFIIKFNSYFKNEMEKIEKIAKLGLLNTKKHGFIVTSKGRFLIRNIAVIFDKYINNTKNHFSKAI